MTFINWNQMPREECEAAAAQGDEGAIAAMRLHERLDRIDKLTVELQVDMLRFGQTIEKIQELLEKR